MPLSPSARKPSPTVRLARASDLNGGRPDRFREFRFVQRCSLSRTRPAAGGLRPVRTPAHSQSLWPHGRCRVLDFGKDAANFAVFRRAAERPQARIEKRPSLRSKQGMWTLFGESGQILKRGHELAGVLSPLERKLLKVVEG